jgi:hypothetical protein
VSADASSQHGYLDTDAVDEDAEPHRCKPIPLRLDENVEDNAILIDRAPEIVRDAVDLQEHLVEMPFIAGSSSSSQPSAYSLPNLSHHRRIVS